MGDAVQEHLQLVTSRSQRQQRQQRCNDLLDQIRQLRERLAASTLQRQQLRDEVERLQEAGPARWSGPGRLMAEHAVRRALGVCWAGRDDRLSDTLQVLFRPPHSRPEDNWTLMLRTSRDEQLQLVSSRLPSGIDVEQLLQRYSSASQIRCVVSTLREQTASFAARRCQVLELDATTSSKWPATWHDAGLRDVRPQFQLLSADGTRLRVTLQLLYAADRQLPDSCKLHQVRPRVDQEDQQQLREVLSLFTEMPLKEAYLQAFANA